MLTLERKDKDMVEFHGNALRARYQPVQDHKFDDLLDKLMKVSTK